MTGGAPHAVPPALAAIRARVKAVRSRALIRRHELLQLAHARGVWFRLRRLLADAERVLVVSPGQAQALLDEGLSPSPVGMELHPTKVIVCVTAVRARRLASVREIRPGLTAELLGATHLVFVSF